jgi:hypothetical protein
VWLKQGVVSEGSLVRLGIAMSLSPLCYAQLLNINWHASRQPVYCEAGALTDSDILYRLEALEAKNTKMEADNAEIKAENADITAKYAG